MTPKQDIAYLDVPYIQVLGGVSPGQVPGEVKVVVLHYPGYQVRCGDPCCTLGSYKPPHLLDGLINILIVARVVRKVIVSNKVNLGAWLTVTPEHRKPPNPNPASAQPHPPDLNTLHPYPILTYLTILSELHSLNM